LTFARLFALIRSNKNIFNWGISAIFLEQAAVDFIRYFIAGQKRFLTPFLRQKLNGVKTLNYDTGIPRALISGW